MKWITLLLVAAVVLVIPASAEVITNDQVPFNASMWVPCAAGGSGEMVEVSGTLHVLITETMDRSGGAHYTSHYQPMGISGVGLTTGDKYQATGITRSSTNLIGPPPVTDTYVNNFRIIGAGTGNNFLVHQVVHITINADGTVVVDFDKASSECK